MNGAAVDDLAQDGGFQAKGLKNRLGGAQGKLTVARQVQAARVKRVGAVPGMHVWPAAQP